MLAKAEGWHSTAWVRFGQRLELHLAVPAALLDRQDLCRVQVVRCASHRNAEANPESSSSTLHLHRVVEPPHHPGLATRSPPFHRVVEPPHHPGLATRSPPFHRVVEPPHHPGLATRSPPFHRVVEPPHHPGLATRSPPFHRVVEPPHHPGLATRSPPFHRVVEPPHHPGLATRSPPFHRVVEPPHHPGLATRSPPFHRVVEPPHHPGLATRSPPFHRVVEAQSPGGYPAKRQNFLAPPLPRRRLRRRAKRVGALPNRQHLVPMEAVLHRPCQIASRATKSQAGYPVISRGRRKPEGPLKRSTTPLAVGPQARAVMEAAVAANKSRRHRLTLSSS